jgi:hypothetical protein
MERATDGLMAVAYAARVALDRDPSPWLLNRQIDDATGGGLVPLLQRRLRAAVRTRWGQDLFGEQNRVNLNAGGTNAVYAMSILSGT